MNRNLLGETVKVMEIYGGRFASAIAIACRRADVSNLERLLNAFPELFEEYEKMYLQIEANKEQENE